MELLKKIQSDKHLRFISVVQAIDNGLKDVLQSVGKNLNIETQM